MNSIEIDGLSKRYRLGERADPYLTIRDALMSALRPRTQEAQMRDIWALRGIDLRIAEGDVVGIVGRNGAGKSTLLKMVARITEPTEGVARMRGRVGALLEVGTGFHFELTGRENIFLNGAILGMSRRDIRRRFDEIVEFSGVERFLDTPLKRYSSGMYLRLAFSVAAHLEPDIVVVDEVLAVGDAEFQRKCLGKMSDLRTEGRTVLFVSHDMGAIGQLCRRTVWLDGGTIREDGSTHDVLDAYFRATVEAGSRVDFEPDPSKPAQVLSLAVMNETGSTELVPRRDETFALRARISNREHYPGLDVSMWLVNSQGIRVLSERYTDRESDEGLMDLPGEYEATLTIPPILPAGAYVAGVWLGSANSTAVYEEPLRFDIRPLPDDRQEALERNRLIVPPVRWHLRSTTREQASLGI